MKSAIGHIFRNTKTNFGNHLKIFGLTSALYTANLIHKKYK